MKQRDIEIEKETERQKQGERERKKHTQREIERERERERERDLVSHLSCKGIHPPVEHMNSVLSLQLFSQFISSEDTHV